MTIAHISLHCILKDTLKAFDDFKNKQKSVWSNVFRYVKVCIIWKCVQYTIHWDKIQMLKKISFGQNKRYKKCTRFSFPSSNSSQLLLIYDSYMSWSTKFVSLKLCVRFLIPFRFYFIFLKYAFKVDIFVQQYVWTLRL